METIEQKPFTKTYVHRRIREWKKRIATIYGQFSDAIKDKPEYELRTGRPVKLFEEPMYEAQVPAVEIPTAEMRKNGKNLFHLIPRGLWVIGANGLIDILTAKGGYVLYDSAEEFEKPNWLLFTPDDRKLAKPFNQMEISKILEFHKP